MNTITTLAYLAPEIPSLSATFVYTEILALQKRGLTVVPISVHYPAVPAQETAARPLLETTTYLYHQPWRIQFRAHLTALWHHPWRYGRAIGTLGADLVTLKRLNQTTFKLIYQFWQAASVASLLRTHACEHLHIHFAHVPTQIGMYAALMTGTPFSFVSHANDLFVRKLLLRQKVERAKAAIAISAYNAQVLINQENADPAKLQIVRCGIDTTEYTFNPKIDPDHPPIIGSLGRLVQKKGMDTLILAVAQLHQQGLPCRLDIAGDGPLRADLQDLADRYHLTPFMTFRGAIAHDQVSNWMRGLDAFVLACRKDAEGDQDGIPVVLMEAMATGIPVCSTCISGIPELIAPGMGLLVEPDHPPALATQLQQLLFGTNDSAVMLKQAREQIETEFDQQINIERLLAILNSAANNNKRFQ